MEPTADREPSPRTRAWAVEAVREACRRGRLDLDGMERRLEAIFRAETDAEVYTAIAGLPHPPAPLVLDDGTGPHHDNRR